MFSFTPMTLVIAQRIHDNVTFSSDSRMTFGTDGIFDLCIKIFKVNARLRGPARSAEDFNNWEFDYDYGLAVVGSSINSYTVKDSISEIIANLQYISDHSDISITGIGLLVLKVYSDISLQLSQILRERGICEILLTGYCLIQKRIRILHFYTKVNDTGLDFGFREILENDGVMFFGRKIIII